MRVKCEVTGHTADELETAAQRAVERFAGSMHVLSIDLEVRPLAVQMDGTVTIWTADVEAEVA